MVCPREDFPFGKAKKAFRRFTTKLLNAIKRVFALKGLSPSILLFRITLLNSYLITRTQSDKNIDIHFQKLCYNYTQEAI
jgi:hypothetical protein